jgi:creatinine amidohydrolase
MIKTAEATWPEIQAAIQKGCIAILPVGAHEQHGPHCALSTDTVICSGLAAHLAQSLDALLLPAIPFGETWNTEGFAGTLSLSFDTVRSIVLDLGKGLKKQNVRAMVVVNGHFGNHMPIELACRTLTEEYGLPCIQIDFPGLEHIASEVCESKPAAPSFYHADEFETSIMLHLLPQGVQMDKARPEYPVFPPTFGVEPMRLNRFNKSGVFGDPRPATAEKGELLLKKLAEESLSIIQNFLSTLA